MKKPACLFLVCVLAVGCGQRVQGALEPGALTQRTAGEVSFIVVSGIGTLGPAADPLASLAGTLDRCNTAGADFAVVLGDIWPAAALGADDLARQWDAGDAVCGKLAMPHVLVPGDRDIWSAATHSQWLKRYGPSTFSWDLGGAHFIALCSDLPGRGGQIAGEQLDWLRNDLARSAVRGTRIFVFVHRPLWACAGGQNGQANPWNAEVHPLLARYGVDTVFAGHRRQYCMHPTRDNVRYIVAGGAVKRYELAGEFDHFVKVTVAGPRANLAVVTPRGSLGPQCVMAEPLEMMRRSLTAAVSAPAGKTGQVELTVSVPNPTDLPAKAILVCVRLGSTWIPAIAQADVPPGGKATLTTTTSYTRLLSLPQAHVELQSADRLLFGWHDVLARAITVAVARRKRIAEVPKLDGIEIAPGAAHWSGRGLRIEALSTIGRTVAQKGDSAAKVRLGWDADGLLVLVNVRDDTITTGGPGAAGARGDSVELCVSSGRNREDVYCVTVVPPADKDAETRTFFRSAGKPRTLQAKVVAAPTEDGYTVAARLPWSNLGLTPATGRLVGVQVMVNDADGPGQRVRMGWYPLGHPLSDADGFGSICVVKLSEKASPPETVAVRAGTVMPLASSVEVAAPAQWAGKAVAVKQGDKILARGTLRPQAGQARADLTFGLSDQGTAVGIVDVYVDGKKIETVDLGDVR